VLTKIIVEITRNPPTLVPLNVITALEQGGDLFFEDATPRSLSFELENVAGRIALDALVTRFAGPSGRALVDYAGCFVPSRIHNLPWPRPLNWRSAASRVANAKYTPSAVPVTVI